MHKIEMGLLWPVYRIGNSGSENSSDQSITLSGRVRIWSQIIWVSIRGAFHHTKLHSWCLMLTEASLNILWWKLACKLSYMKSKFTFAPHILIVFWTTWAHLVYTVRSMRIPAPPHLSPCLQALQTILTGLLGPHWVREEGDAQHLQWKNVKTKTKS